ncbi:hypothetical protein sos41_19060 [Alphaproteobacteria bacterium SO-S41]|nr:hypothetical protein sos41_19060 [Alphaproteobacteria bacterium SO-S41]
MFQILPMAQQSVSPEMLAGVGITALVIGLLIGAAIAALIVGLLLKFVGQAVLGYPVKYGSSFLSIFIAVLVSGAIGIALVFGGVLKPEIATGGGVMAQIMPQGPVVFAINQALSLIIMSWAIHTFLKGPGDVRPSWGSAFIISIVMTVILIAFSFLLLQVMPRPA